MLSKRRLYSWLAIIPALVFLWLGAGHWQINPIPTKADTAKLQVSFLDVGQGDAILIQAPGGKKVLLDGGEDGDKLLSNLDEEFGWRDKKIDLMVLSHPHADHVRGFNSLFGRYQISEVVGTGVLHNSSVYEAWLTNIKNNNLKLKTVKAGETIDLGGGATLQVLFPFSDLNGQTVSNLNNSSLVLKLTYGQISFLLTGDAEEEVEKQLLASSVDVSAQVLKVAHHGSANATSMKFLEAVKPQLAIISVGKDNDFGHPHDTTLNKLEASGAKILRTDELGTIKISTDGKSIEVSGK
jgi:competence protein ComEC